MTERVPDSWLPVYVPHQIIISLVMFVIGCLSSQIDNSFNSMAQPAWCFRCKSSVNHVELANLLIVFEWCLKLNSLKTRPFTGNAAVICIIIIIIILCLSPSTITYLYYVRYHLPCVICIVIKFVTIYCHVLCVILSCSSPSTTMYRHKAGDTPYIQHFNAINCFMQHTCSYFTSAHHHQWKNNGYTNTTDLPWQQRSPRWPCCRWTWCTWRVWASEDPPDPGGEESLLQGLCAHNPRWTHTGELGLKAKTHTNMNVWQVWPVTTAVQHSKPGYV